jgi:hypothetical protein
MHHLKTFIHTCISCWGLQNKSRLTIQGKRVQLGNAIHPYHEIYKTEGWFQHIQPWEFLLLKLIIIV